MGILSGMFKAIDKPTNKTAGSAYRFLFGSATSGKAVTKRSAMQMTAVYSCVRILAEAVAGLPLHLYRYNDSGGKEKAIDHTLYILLHDEPNPEMPSFVFRETLMPNRMRVDRDEKGRIYYQYQVSDADAPTMKEGTVRLKQTEKTDAGESTLPMSDEVHECFKRVVANYKKRTVHPIIKVENGTPYTGFLFLDKNGKPEVALHWENHFRWVVAKYNRTYKEELSSITPHVARHTYCTNMAKAGMNPKTLQYLMGHSDIGVTLNTYTHVKFEDAKEEVVRLATVNE